MTLATHVFQSQVSAAQAGFMFIPQIDEILGQP